MLQEVEGNSCPDGGDLQDTVGYMSGRPSGTVRTRDTPIAQAAILRELLFREKAKPQRVAQESQRRHREEGRVSAGGSPPAGRRGLMCGKEGFCCEGQPLNDLDALDADVESGSGHLHYQNIPLGSRVSQGGASGQGTSVSGHRSGSGQGTGHRSDSGQGIRQKICSGKGSGQKVCSGQGSCSGQAADLGQVVSNMATGGDGLETISDAKLAQLLQGEEYGAEVDQDRLLDHHDTVPRHQDTVPSHQDTIPNYQDTIPGHQETIPGHQETIPGHQDTIPGHQDTTLNCDPLSDQRSDYLLAKCAQEQADAELAMQLQNGSKKEDHTHWQSQLQEQADAQVVMQLQSRGGASGRGSGINGHTHQQLQEQADAEMAMQLQSGGEASGWSSKGNDRTHFQLQEEADAEMVMQLQSGGGASGCGSEGRGQPRWQRQVQEQMDAELAMQLQAGDTERDGPTHHRGHTHRCYENYDNNGVLSPDGRTLLFVRGTRGYRTMAQGHGTDYQMQQEAQQIDMSYEVCRNLYIVDIDLLAGCNREVAQQIDNVIWCGTSRLQWGRGPADSTLRAHNLLAGCNREVAQQIDNAVWCGHPFTAWSFY